MPDVGDVTRQGGTEDPDLARAGDVGESCSDRLQIAVPELPRENQAQESMQENLAINAQDGCLQQEIMQLNRLWELCSHDVLLPRDSGRGLQQDFLCVLCQVKPLHAHNQIHHNLY
jgi:hypothetical protein